MHKKLIYCLKLQVTHTENLAFIKERSFTERLGKD